MFVCCVLFCWCLNCGEIARRSQGGADDRLRCTLQIHDGFNGSNWPIVKMVNVRLSGISGRPRLECPAMVSNQLSILRFRFSVVYRFSLLQDLWPRWQYLWFSDTDRILSFFFFLNSFYTADGTFFVLCGTSIFFLSFQQYVESWGIHERSWLITIARRGCCELSTFVHDLLNPFTFFLLTLEERTPTTCG